MSSRIAKDDLRRFVLYAICGGSGVLTDLATYATLLHFDVGYQAANLAGYFAGTLLSFTLNRRFTFGVLDHTARRLGLFFGVAAVGYVVSTLLLWGLVEAAHLHPLFAKLLTLFVVLVVQFSLNRSITFRTASEEKA